jgi:hypothetical protein
MKNPKLTLIIKLVLLYLAISKIMSLLGTVHFTSNEYGDFSLWYTIFPLVNRILWIDIPIIFSVIIFYFVEKYLIHFKNKRKTVINQILSFVINYIIVIGIYMGYMISLSMMFGVSILNEWFTFWLAATITYIPVVIFIKIKLIIKSRKQEKINETAINNADIETLVIKLYEAKILDELEYNEKLECCKLLSQNITQTNKEGNQI